MEDRHIVCVDVNSLFGLKVSGLLDVHVLADHYITVAMNCSLFALTLSPVFGSNFGIQYHIGTIRTSFGFVSCCSSFQCWCPTTFGSKVFTIQTRTSHCHEILYIAMHYWRQGQLYLPPLPSPFSQGYPHQAFFGVLDGHIGVEAAVYSSVHILPNIVRHPAFLADPEKAMKEGILSTDQRYCEKVTLHRYGHLSPK